MAVGSDVGDEVVAVFEIMSKVKSPGDEPAGPLPIELIVGVYVVVFYFRKVVYS